MCFHDADQMINSVTSDLGSTLFTQAVCPTLQPPSHFLTFIASYSFIDSFHFYLKK